VNATQKIPKSFDSINWTNFFGSMGLRNEEAVNRLMRLLVLHMLADRVLSGTVVLAMRPPGGGDKALNKVAEIGFAQRIDIAELCGAISETIATDLRVLNKVRNAFSHFKPARGWGFEEMPELATEVGFRACAAPIVSALQAMVPAMTRMHRRRNSRLKKREGSSSRLPHPPADSVEEKRARG